MHKALDINIHCKKLVTSSMICNGLCCMKELVNTENATFNFWALETCRKFLLYFCRIYWAQDILLVSYIDPCFKLLFTRT